MHWMAAQWKRCCSTASLMLVNRAGKFTSALLKVSYLGFIFAAVSKKKGKKKKVSNMA